MTQTLKTSRAKENILGRIRKQLSDDKLLMPFPEAEKNTAPLYPMPQFSAEEDFVLAFKALGGKFIFCDSEQDFATQVGILQVNLGWKQILCTDKKLSATMVGNGLSVEAPQGDATEQADVCITGCEALIGRTGSILLTSAQPDGRTAPVFYPVHVVFAYLNQIHFELADALKAIKAKYGTELPSMINVATGPSRTADIEKTLVVGVHGPREVYVALINAEI